MKFIKLYIILFFIITHHYYAQEFIFLSDAENFGNAISFSINQAGLLYVTDSDKNEITKLDTLGNIQKKVGGYGWQESFFDYPSDIFAGTLNVFVADKNNDRIQIFDKDLNFLSLIKSENNSENSFRYPNSIAVSNQGDFFILDSDNSRILKYNLRGEYQFQIGNFDAGIFSLNNPKKITITSNENIAVIDQNNLFLFDQFGNGLSKQELNFEPRNINSTSFGITLTDGKSIFFSDLSVTGTNNSFKIFSPGIDENINDALLFNSKLYVLTPHSIFIYQITQ